MTLAEFEKLENGKRLQYLLDLCLDAMEVWENASHRIQILGELSHWMSQLDPSIAHNKHIARLCTLAPEKMATLTEFEAIRVPIEREVLGNNTNAFGTDLIVPHSLMPVHVALDSLRSAHNVGSILRSADAAGIECVHFTGYTAAPDHPQVRKTAKSAQPNFTQHGSLLDKIKELKKSGLTLYGFERTESSKSLFERPLKFPCCFVFGSERFGLNQSCLELCDEVRHLPMYGKKASLNVANAVSVCIYEARRQFNHT